MDYFDWSRADIIAAGSFLLASIVAGVTLYRNLLSGPRLVIEIIPPRLNRKNKRDTDRVITVAVTNQGDKQANIWKLQLKTVESRFVFSRKVISEATFDDTTPWTPSAKVGPHDTKIYDLQFFDGWSKGSSQPHRIEVAVFIRASDKPFIARRWG